MDCKGARLCALKITLATGGFSSPLWMALRHYRLDGEKQVMSLGTREGVVGLGTAGVVSRKVTLPFLKSD